MLVAWNEVAESARHSAGAPVEPRQVDEVTVDDRAVGMSPDSQRPSAHRWGSRHMGQIFGPPGIATSLVISKPWRPYKARFRSLDDSR
jgi:hypothetical protein